MRVVLTADRVAGFETADVCRDLLQGWTEAAPGDEVTVLVGSDGGPGMLTALVGDRVGIPGVAEDVAVSIDQTVWLQAAACTDGGDIARVLDAVMATEPERVVIGLGGVAEDGTGIAFLKGLGAHIGEDGVDLDAVDDKKATWSRVDIVAAWDDDRTFLGRLPTSGATPESRILAEQQYRADRAVVKAADGLRDPSPDLLALGMGFGTRVSGLPGSRAGGGLGFALALTGARLVPAGALLATATGLDRAVAQADLVVMAVDLLDWDTVAQGLLGYLTGQLADGLVPLVVVARETLLGRRDFAGSGITTAYPVDEDFMTTGRRVARTWSPQW